MDPILRDNCGSFAEYGYMGRHKDLLVQDLLRAASKGPEPDQLCMSPDVFALWSDALSRRAKTKPLTLLGMTVLRSSNMPEGCLRIYHGNTLLVQQTGWTA